MWNRYQNKTCHMICSPYISIGYSKINKSLGIGIGLIFGELTFKIYL
jgi:hypothetical protein